MDINAIPGEENQRGDNCCPLVAVNECLCLRQMKRIPGGNIKQVSTSVIKNVFRRGQRRFNQSRIAQTLTAAMLNQAASMDAKNFIERQKNWLVYLASALKSSRFSRKTTSQASSNESFLPSHGLAFAPWPPTTFLVSKTKSSCCSFAGSSSICCMISVALMALN